MLYTELSVGWIPESLAAAKNGPGITLSPADTVSDAFMPGASSS